MKATDGVPPNHPLIIDLAGGSGGPADPAGSYQSGLNDISWGRSGTAYTRYAQCWVPYPYAGNAWCESGA